MIFRIPVDNPFRQGQGLNGLPRQQPTRADPCSHGTFQLHDGSKLSKRRLRCLETDNLLLLLPYLSNTLHDTLTIHTHENKTNCLQSHQLFLPHTNKTSTMSTADELKALGNKAIAEKNFDEAV